jgi:hypothetical protein
LPDDLLVLVAGMIPSPGETPALDATVAGGNGGVMELFPSMPLAEWQDTKATLHRYVQVVGKIRLAASVRRNHWWNVPFHLTGRGITTRPMGQADGNQIFALDFDFVDHRLLATTVDGTALSFPLYGQSVASFYRNILDALATLNVEVNTPIPSTSPMRIGRSARTPKTPPTTRRYWQVLSQVNLLLEEFAARYSGKASPVHHFWHTFDIAHTRFSDRQAHAVDVLTTLRGPPAG